MSDAYDSIECHGIASASNLDYWDQPLGPWGDGENTNSFYRMGGRALARNDDDPEFWLRRAVEGRHTGGYFRMALASLRRRGGIEFVGYMRAAQFSGHADAEPLLKAWALCREARIHGDEAERLLLDAVPGLPQDPAFAAEVALLLARRL
ncbi:hypothetical protein AB0N28_03455 [Streptomyces sp. NPDC051130]|uniref:hypothetical protein n=1 Tax=Streptomyces sp. NPDC051130 TaxID=3157223 RepID=UPI0034477053